MREMYMEKAYELHTDSAVSLFYDRRDVLSALFLLGSCRGVEIERGEVERSLEKYGFWECEADPLSVIETTA